MDTTKIRLSPEEETLITRADWILTKNRVIQKTKLLLAALQIEQKKFLELTGNNFPAEIADSSPKISKGENYKGLPYLVLDYPRYFNKEDYFAIRVLFWWGNFFSCTLHLSGSYKEKYDRKIFSSFEFLKANDFFVCINEDQWEHHFEPVNYLPLHEFTAPMFEELLQRNFLKLSKKIPLQQWNDAEQKMLEIFSQLIRTMTA